MGDFAHQKTEIVGPKVGKNLQQQAISATFYALGGMLVYIAWRFKGAVYGTAAVIAVFHDVIIVLGFFSFFNKEISLTVIAALVDAGWLFDERHDRGLRSNSREFENVAERASELGDQQEHQPDA